MEKPFSSALPVLDAILNAGFEAYFVGGAVRDHVLSKPVDDIDIATSARPEEIKNIFSKTVDIGIDHGTILVLHKGNSYEVTTFRTESGYKDFRRPDKVEFVSNLNEDLKRRDFTMNAMAMDKEGNLLDPFGGREDIESRQIKTVGKPSERFGEDALRVMRATRFASQLGFTIEAQTYSSLAESAHLLKHIAVERKRVEFEKLFLGANRKIGLGLLCSTGMLQYLPGLSGKEAELQKMIDCKVEILGLNEMWALLLQSIDAVDKEAESILREWKLPSRQIKEILDIFKYFRFRLKNEWDALSLFNAGKNGIASAEKLIMATSSGDFANKVDEWLSRYDSLPIKSRDKLAVSGGDLLQWYGKNGGPWVRDMLNTVEKAVLEGNVANEKDTIREWLLRCNQK
ncbi:CCA tRNA nucleotidyltransferase [Bacillus sp. B-jedd]|uniref:CCA tRNA nucleotidyltransferase n=1 Tax=Bacillus sp. B-jedd TaxID=1476857 RepID=UPI0005156698|nr:CCA tRNA nucleotidyltransferase [Bacillus sp. B-jedd]CEG27633.1 tRNA cytidylyltransferase [Bacillus sp. B-jedd]